jgi:small subunit ribosomal protein S2
MKKYIFGARNKIHILDLQKTIREIRSVYRFVKETVSSGGTVLFVGTKPQAQQTVKSEAQRCGAFFVTNRWLGGTLTNFETIKKSIAKLEQLEKMKSDGLFEKLSKKESKMRTKQLTKLQTDLEGIRDMKTLPSIVFIVDTVKENIALREARRMKIPVVAICDTDADPDLVDYPIPANDDAIRSIKLICSIIADAVIEGKQLRPEGKEQLGIGGTTSSEIPISEPVSEKDLKQEINFNENFNESEENSRELNK